MDNQRPTKRPRLSMACNECRRRKVKCDADYPQCKNCAQRKLECITTDPKRPGASVVREWIEDKASFPSPRLSNSDDALSHPSTVANTSAHQRQLPQANSNNDDQINLTNGVADIDHNQNAGSVAQTSPVQDSSIDATEVSPVYNPYDMSFHLDQNTNRIKMMGASSSQCLVKSLDVYLELARVKPVAPTLKYGMRHAEEMILPLAITLPPFPDIDKRRRYIDAFFKRIHTLWPVLDIDDTKSAIHAFASLSSLVNIPHEQVPLLATAYLVMSLGADEVAHQLTEDGNTYLQAATSLLGHLILMPYLSAVQSLVVFTIAYRGRNKDGLGWQTAGMAVRIAHSLGLHKHSTLKPYKDHGVTEKRTQLYHARIWAICCCLEKIIQLESGRPSAIIVLNKDQMMIREQRPPGPNFLEWNMGLAEFQNEIGQHIYGHRPGDRLAKDILQNTARLDRALLAWSKQIPQEFQPENAIFCSKEEFHFAAFFAIQFHQAMITLHRAALIAPTGTFDAEVDKWCSEEPSKNRLQKGELICIESARAIIRLSLELPERNAESRIFTAGPPMLAAIALAVFLLKHPRGKSQAADLELLKAVVEYTSDEYIKSGQDRRMAQGIASIYDKVRLYIRSRSTAQKRSHGGEPIASQTIPDSTPSSKSGETASDGTPNTNAQLLQRPTSAPQIAMTTQEGQNSSLDPSRSNRVDNHQSPSSVNTDRGNMMMPDNFFSRAGRGTTVSPWTLPTNHQNQQQFQLVQGPSEGVFDSLMMSQDVSGGDQYLDRLPFGEFNVEEMWNWMCQMDATNDFTPIANLDPNLQE